MQFEKRETLPWEQGEKYFALEGDYLGQGFTLYVQGGKILGGVIEDNSNASWAGTGTFTDAFLEDGSGASDERVRKLAKSAVEALKNQLGLK